MTAYKHLGISGLAFIIWVLSLFAREKIGFLINPSYYYWVLAASIFSLIMVCLYALPYKYILLKPKNTYEILLSIFSIALLASSFVIPINPLGSQNANSFNQKSIVKKPNTQLTVLKSPETITTLSLSDWLSTLTYATSSEEYNGQRVEIKGFVSKHTDLGYHLSVYRISCCVVDASLITIEIKTNEKPALDSWYAVEGVIGYNGQKPNQTFFVELIKQNQIPTPNNPYQSN
jgi:uncharacterized repeat protein (TIGR03943 family)